MDVLNILRQYRIGPFTIFDTATAYLGIFLLSPLLSKLFYKLHINISRSGWLWLTLPISVIFHLVFRQNTPLMKILSDPFKFELYLVLVVLFFMTYMGLRKIKTMDRNP
jgi:hypothetical protein